MFLSSWYFCKTIHLSIKETARFIDTILALQDPDLPAEKKRSALKHLLHMEPLCICYAFPALVDGLLTSSSKWELYTEEEQSAQLTYRAEAKACIRSMVPEASKNRYLHIVIESLSRTSPYVQLAQYLRELDLPSAEGRAFQGYLELEFCTAEILALALLRAAARAVPEEILEIVDSGTQKPWFTAALNGALGDLPWALAVEILSLCGNSANVLQPYFPRERWLCSPDKMELAARICFLPGSGDVSAILQETFDLKLLTSLYAYSVNASVQYASSWLDPGMDKEQQKKYLVVLWQVSLWALAVERDPITCMRSFPAYWGIPLESIRMGQHYRFNRVFQQILTKNRDASSLPQARLAVCSPWLLRKKVRNSSQEKFPLTEYPELLQNHLALRAFVVPVLMCRLLRAMPKDEAIPDYFIRLLFCYGDAFGFRTIRRIYYQLQNDSGDLPREYTPAIHSLLLCAYSAVWELGSGQINSRVPEHLVNLLKRESPILNEEYRFPRPHRNLFSESAFITAAHWAHESLSNVTFNHGIEENPWLCGGYQSCGAQVCQWFFNEVWDSVEERAPGSIRNYAREATQLAFQVFPDILEQSGRKASAAAIISGSGNVFTQELLLSDDLSYEDWMHCTPVTAQRFKADAYSIALSLRLRALLTYQNETRPSLAEDGWVSEWNNHFYSMQAKAELSRICRYLISSFFSVAASGPEQEDVLLDTCRLVIDTIVEFSNDAPFYLQHLAEELARPLPIRDDSAAMLRRSFLFALMQYAEKEKDLLPAERKTTQLLLYYMMKIADQFQSDPMCAQQMQNQRNAGRLSAYRYEQKSIKSVSPDEVSPDEVSPDKFLNHVLYHRIGDYLQGTSANIQLPFFAKLHNGFQTDTVAPQGEWQLGTVLSSSKAPSGNEVSLYLNMGRGQAEAFRFSPDDKRFFHFHVGDLVAVKRSDPPQIAWPQYVNSQTVNSQTVNSQPDVVRAKNFEIEGSRVKVNINGHVYNSAHTNQPVRSAANLYALGVWDPDVCASHKARSANKYSGGSCLVSFKRFEDGSSFWMPEEQDFLMLLAKRLLPSTHPEHEISLVYIEGSAREHLFSAAPGENYRLTEDVWTADSFQALQAELSRTDDVDTVSGLRIRVQLTMDERGAPRLVLAKQEPFDRTNLRFRSLFQDEQLLTIRQEGSNWVVPPEANASTPTVTANWVRMPANFQKVRDTAAEVQVAENGWDLIAQRECRLSVTPLTIQQLTPPLLSAGELESFLNLQAGDRVPLAHINDRPSYGYYKGKLPSGIQVKVAAESVSWGAYKTSPHLFSNREAIVENVHPSSKTADRKPVPCQLAAEELNGYTHMEGIVSRIAIISTSNTSHSNTEDLSVDINVLAGDRSILIEEVPRDAFSPEPGKIGEVFEAVKGIDGWTFQVKFRNVSVRALWKMVDHTEEDNQQVTGQFLSMAEIYSYGVRTVTQDLQEPILHLWDPTACSELKSMISEGDGRVQRLTRRFCRFSIFRSSFNTDIVRLVTARGEYVGEAPSGMFSESLAGWSSCQLQIYRVLPDPDGPQYDLRRTFLAELAKPNLKEDRDLERLAQWQSRYHEWCEAGDFHEVGALRQTPEGQMLFEMNDLRLPLNGNAEAPLEQWTGIVPLSDPVPLVSGRNYDAKNARAYLYLQDGMWHASIRDAKPMTLTGFAQFFNVTPPGRSLSITLVFAGYNEEDHLVFEWGYGFTLIVKPSELQIGQAACGTHSLFFGDRIKGFALEWCKEGESWRLRIPYEKIVYEIEGRIWRDAVSGIVQQLIVRRFSAKNTVRIFKVSVSAPEIGTAVEGGRHWDFTTVSNAVLDDSALGSALDILPDTEEAIILARLDTTVDEHHLRTLRFTMIGEEFGNELQKGDILCLVGGAIEPKIKDDSPRIGNDYRMTFFLPQNVAVSMSAPLQVHVQRRYFSYDESILRVQYRKDPMAYSGHYMIVRLADKPDNTAGPPVWQGSVIHAAYRPPERLYDWVKAQRTISVILGEKNGDCTSVEIAPGIISYIATQPEFERGMLATLQIEDDKMRAKRVLLGDREYIPRQGRPVELLIMDGTWRKPEEGSLRPSKFTIAGAPQIMFQDRALMEREMRKAPPRFAFLRAFGAENKVVYRVDDSVPVLAGYLRCEAADMAPRVVPISAPEENYICSWQQLSYLDGTTEEVYTHAARGRWYYHERFTGILYDEQQPPKKVLWPKGAQFNQIPLLFAKGWRLRYTPKELPQYVFSARAITESGLPEDGGWYPVAHSTAGSLYIEFLPGKIVDIPNSMLVMGRKKYDLTHACMKVFAAGDQVQMSIAQAPGSTQIRIQLSDFRFGLRGMFAKENALLRIRAIIKGGLSLGSSTWCMTIPCEQDGAWSTGDWVALRQNQPPQKITSFHEIMEGDTILIAWSNGRFFIPGFPEKNIWINHDRTPGDNWVDRLLVDSPESLFAVLPTLPVRIKQKSLIRQRQHLWFAYEQDPFEEFTSRCQLPCVCLGEFPGSMEENRQVLLRAGSCLLKADSNRLLPGMPTKRRSEVIQFLAKSHTTFWMHWEESGWTTGLVGQAAERSRVRLLAPIPKAEGILCQNQDTLSFCWLPVEESSRAKGADVETLYRVLPHDCNAAVRENQTISLIRVQESCLQFESMGATDRQFRVVPKYLVSGDDTGEAGIFHYLCQRYPKGDVFWLASERELRQEELGRNPIPVEIVQKSRENVKVVPAGTRRIPLDLPSWIFARLRDSVLSHEESCRSNGFLQTVPRQFEAYRQIIQSAESVRMGDFLIPPGNCETKLLALFAAYLRNRRRMGKSFPYVKFHLANWLEKTGMALATGMDIHTELDLLPAIAAILMMSAMSEQKKELSGLTVHLARMLGNAAGGNIHQEIILTHWLLSTQEHSQNGLWNRLNRLQLYGQTFSGEASDKFDGTLTQTQFLSLISTCNSILNRNCVPNQDGDPLLSTVAHSLLLAAGVKSDYSPLYYSGTVKRSCCFRLHQLGKALTPGKGYNLAVEELSAPQIRYLTNVFLQLKETDAPPITLNMQNMYPLSSENRAWAEEECAGAIKLLKNL